jgi:hypothetical protein
MIYIISTLIGVIIGILLKNKIIKFAQSIVIPKIDTFNIKFHVYFVMHPNGSKLNEIIKTDTIQISVNSKSEDDAIEFVKDLINDEIRVEIESVEII